MALPLVSIIIPCYNAEKEIATTIQSALAQTYADCEVIVIDDGSTDRSLEIIKGFGDKIRWRTGSNRGGCAARNIGLHLSEGEWIQFLDADDLISPNKIQAQVSQLRGLPEGYISVSNIIYFFDGDKPEEGIRSMGYPELDSDNPSEWLIQMWGEGCTKGTGIWGMVPYHAYLSPKASIEKAGPWDESLSIDQDGEYFARVLTSSKGIRWQPGTFAYYRKFRARHSTSRGRSAKSYEDNIASIHSKVRCLEGDPNFSWSSDAHKAIARQYMGVCVNAVPWHLRVARKAAGFAKEHGGYSGRCFFKSTKKMSLISRVLTWPVYKTLREIAKRMRGN